MSRLGRLVSYLNDDVVLSADGRAIALDVVSDLVSERAKLLEDRVTYPQISSEIIERPVFVAGFGRSGTTLLHMLLDADPNARSPQWWETRFASPPPSLGGPDDPRLARADAEMHDLLETVPVLRQAHPYFDAGGRSSVECEGIAALDLRAVRRTIYFRVPAAISIDLEDDLVGYYEFHKKVLQALQWGRPPKRWALKGLGHHTRLAALKSVYPDARVIWLHRDPQKVFPSWAELTIRHDEGMAGRPLDRKLFGRAFLERFGLMLDESVASPLADHPHVCHLQYTDFARDHIGQLEDVYRRLDLPFEDSTAQAMRAWLDDPSNRGDRHGKFRYALEPFGVSPDELEGRAAAYRARFSVAVEG
jgi:hypothetical protein